MTEAFSNDTGEELPTSGKALSKHKFFISGALESDVIAYLREDGSALGFVWVCRVLVEDG